MNHRDIPKKLWELGSFRDPGNSPRRFPGFRIFEKMLEMAG